MKFNKQYFNDCQAPNLPTQYQSRYPNVHSNTPSQLNSTLNYKNYLSLYCATGFSIWVCMGNKSWKTGWAWHYSKTELFVKPESEVPKSRQKGLGLTLTNHTCCSTSLLISIWRSSCTYRVIGNSGPKVIAYCSQNMKIMDFLTPLGAPQMWSIW